MEKVLSDTSDIEISIITVNYNSYKDTIELIQSILKLESNSYNYEIIVVDNASNYNPEKEIRGISESIKFIRSDINLGFAGGCNLGIKKASGNYLLFINNDAVITGNCLEILLKTFYQNPDAGIVSPKFHFYYQPGIIEYAGYTNINAFTGRNKMIGTNLPDKGQFNDLKETDFCHGGGMMISKKIIDIIGLMCEEYFLYYEEFDWCEKIKNAGYKIYYQPNGLIKHKVSVSTGKDSTLKTYYLTRNRILFMKRNKTVPQYTIFLFFLFFFTVPKNTLKYLFKKQYQHLRVFIAGVLWNFGFKNEIKFN